MKKVYSIILWQHTIDWETYRKCEVNLAGTELPYYFYENVKVKVWRKELKAKSVLMNS